MTDPTPPASPLMRKYREAVEENEKLRARVAELEGNRSFMNVNDIAEYLGFSGGSAVSMLMKREAEGDVAPEDRLPEPIAVFDTPTLRIWDRAQIVAYGEKFGTDRGYKNTKRKRGDA